MSPRVQAPNRKRLGVIAAGLAFLGFSLAAVLNQGVGRYAALPEDAKPLQFNDTPVSDEGAPAVVDGGEAAKAPTPNPVVAASTPRTPSLKSYTDAILRKNLFDSAAVYDPNAAVASGAGECKSEGTVKLLATVVAEPVHYSSALIQMGGKDGGGHGFVIGDEVSGEGRITTIEQKRVCLDNGSCLCMGGDTAVVARAPGPAADDGGISKLSDTKFAVDQSVLDSAMGNFEELATQLKVYPHKGPDGQIDGYRVSAIRPNSLFSKLGLKNGDIVNGVNGQPLTSAEGALATYQTLRSERSFTFDITRKNQKQTMEYEVH